MGAGELMWTMRVGAIELTTLSDGFFEMPLAAFSGAPAKRIASLDVGGGQFRTTVVAWLVRTGDRLALVDAGGGATMGSGLGDLPDGLRSAGAPPEAITDVVVTHMHLDHVGGLIAGGAPTFPNARIHVSAGEWRYWVAPERLDGDDDAARRTAKQIQTIASVIAPQTELYFGAADLGDGISMTPTPGHTPGHVAVELRDGDDRHLLLGDLLLSGELQFEHPDAHFVLDGDVEQSIEARRRMFDWLAEHRVSFSATHLPFPAAGLLQRRGPHFEFRSLTGGLIAA